MLILSHVLEHLDEAEVFLKRFVSYFKYFFIEVPDFDYHYLNVYRIDTQTKLVYSDNDHVTEFDLAELERLVGAAGLRVVDQEHHHGILRLWCERAN